MKTISCPRCGKGYPEAELTVKSTCCGQPLIPPVTYCTEAGVAEHAGHPESDRPCKAGDPPAGPKGQ